MPLGMNSNEEMCQTRISRYFKNKNHRYIALLKEDIG